MSDKLLSQDEIKKAEVDILLMMDEFCRLHKLRYILAYGTLLGAVRHRGFIPWDDDIDIAMPRSDYDKFITLALNGNTPAGCCVQATQLDGFSQSFAKVINPRVRVESGRNNGSVKEWLWIDVFPVDGLPESAKARKRLYFKAKVLGTLSIVSQLNPEYRSTFLMRAATVVFSPLAKRTNLSQWASMALDKLARRYQFGSTSFAGLIGWGFGEREAFPTSYFTDITRLSFEGHFFSAPSKYDDMLKSWYGPDYMQLPPEDKRVTHELVAQVVNEQL